MSKKKLPYKIGKPNPQSKALTDQLAASLKRLRAATEEFRKATDALEKALKFRRSS